MVEYISNQKEALLADRKVERSSSREHSEGRELRFR